MVVTVSTLEQLAGTLLPVLALHVLDGSTGGSYGTLAVACVASSTPILVTCTICVGITLALY